MVNKTKRENEMVVVLSLLHFGHVARNVIKVKLSLVEHCKCM